MKEVVELILQNSKNSQKAINPKQAFFREFDLVLQMAGKREFIPSEQMGKLERFGQEAGISLNEIAYRKKTIHWAFATAKPISLIPHFSKNSIL